MCQAFVYVFSVNPHNNSKSYVLLIYLRDEQIKMQEVQN